MMKTCSLWKIFVVSSQSITYPGKTLKKVTWPSILKGIEITYEKKGENIALLMLPAI